MSETEVVVVGGGPAGLAAAVALRTAKLDVTLVERRRSPIDKSCGEGLMPDGVAELARLGVTFPAASFVPFRGIKFMEREVAATARFSQNPGIGVRRTVLHEALVRRAEALGVHFLWGCSVRGIHPHGLEIDNGIISSRWVIAADGESSRMRRWMGLEVPPRNRRFGIRRHYRVQPWTDLVEVYWSTGCEAYVTPISGNMLCIAMLTDNPALRFDTALQEFPHLQQHLEGADVISNDLSAPIVFRRCRRVVSGRVALVGDAAGSVDAITGKGVTLALHQAVALARCLPNGKLRDYENACRRLMWLPGQMSALMLAIDHRPWLRWQTLRALEKWPWIFTQLLALHT
ncbi:MAG: NAD(P)/FAD-dependent oxidoreductase, partial [Acidobacteriota bacterium]